MSRSDLETKVIEHIEQVGLAKQRQIRLAKRHRIHRQLSVALGDQKQRDILTMACIKVYGTRQIADALNAPRIVLT